MLHEIKKGKKLKGEEEREMEREREEQRDYRKDEGVLRTCIPSCIILYATDVRTSTLQIVSVVPRKYVPDTYCPITISCYYFFRIALEKK